MEHDVSRAITRLHAGILAIVCAVVGGTGVFVMTVWLLIKGGEEVGGHLQLLGHYFIGYSVTWPGSLIGFCYGALLGGVVGWATGKIYNCMVNWRQR